MNGEEKNSAKEVDLSELAGNTAGQAGEAEEKPRQVALSSLLKGVPRGTFVQTQASRLAKQLLAAIIVLTVVLLVMWFATRPGADFLNALAGEQTLTCKEKVDLLDSARSGHLNHFRSVFDLMVAGLVSLFTLLIGYAFGSRETNNTNTGE